VYPTVTLMKHPKGPFGGEHGMQVESPRHGRMNPHLYPGAMDANRTETLGGQPLTRQRKGIFEELHGASWELTQIYEAALRLLDDDAMPARGRLLAHCAREIINRLPDYLNLPVPTGQIQYVPALDRIAPLWQEETNLAGASAGLAESTAHDGSLTEPPTMSISVELHRQIDQLVTTHLQSRMTARQKLRVVIEAAGQPGGGFSQGQLDTLARHWDALRKWFVERVHVPATPGTQEDFAEYVARFNTLEDILYSVLCPFYGPLEELDEILEKTNRPRG
jgi:hypothetical protein